jgi:hypothetical protein
VTAFRLRSKLALEDIRGFAQRAATANPIIDGLAHFDWHEWESDHSATLMNGEIIPAGQDAFRDLVADKDGVFFYGWDESAQVALWRWVPAGRPKSFS